MGFFNDIINSIIPRSNIGEIKIIEDNCKRILISKLRAKGIKSVTVEYKEAKNIIEAIFNYFKKFERENKVNIEELADCKRLIDQDLYRVLKKIEILNIISAHKLKNITKVMTKKMRFGDAITPAMIKIFAQHCEKALELCN